MINLNYLRTFITLVEQKHFTRTADILAMTQPGVTQHLKKLEVYYDTSLLERHGKAFEITPAGEQVYRFGLELVRVEQDLKEQLKKDDPYSGICRISSPGAVGLRLYPQLMHIQQQKPQLSVHYEIAPNHRIEAEVLENNIDLGVMTRKPKVAGLIAYPLGQEQLCLCTPKTFTFYHYSDLKNLGLIHHPDAIHQTGLLLGKNFPSMFSGISDFPIRSYVNQINLILEPVALGLGFTVLPVSVVDAYHRAENINKIDLPELVYETIYQVHKAHSPTAARYQFLIEEVFQSSDT